MINSTIQQDWKKFTKRILAVAISDIRSTSFTHLMIYGNPYSVLMNFCRQREIRRVPQKVRPDSSHQLIRRSGASSEHPHEFGHRIVPLFCNLMLYVPKTLIPFESDSRRSRMMITTKPCQRLTRTPLSPPSTTTAHTPPNNETSMSTYHN